MFLSSEIRVGSMCLQQLERRRWVWARVDSGSLWGRAGEGVAAQGVGALVELVVRSLRAAALASSCPPALRTHSGLLPELALPFFPPPRHAKCFVQCSVAEGFSQAPPSTFIHVFSPCNCLYAFLIVSCFCSM